MDDNPVKSMARKASHRQTYQRDIKYYIQNIKYSTVACGPLSVRLYLVLLYFII